MKQSRIDEFRQIAKGLIGNQPIFHVNLNGKEINELLDEIEKVQSSSKISVIKERLEACLSGVCPIRGDGDNKCPVFMSQQVNQYTTPCYRYPDCFKRRIAYCKGEIDAPENNL